MLHFKLRKMFFHFKKYQLFEIKLLLHLLLTYFLDVGFCIVDKCCVNEDIFQFRGRVEIYKRRKKAIFIWHLGPPIAISIVSKIE